MLPCACQNPTTLLQSSQAFSLLENCVTDQKSLCVYCSSSDALPKAYGEAAAALGAALAQAGYTLVYGGGKIGLMGKLGRAVHQHGGRVIGVIPERLMGQHYPACDELVITQTMRERKEQMEQRADGFICLPGGFGTLEEMLEIITLKQLGYHNKPIVLLDVRQYYEHLLTLFEHLYRDRFVKDSFRNLYYATASIVDAMSHIETYQPITFEEKWFS